MTNWVVPRSLTFRPFMDERFLFKYMSKGEFHYGKHISKSLYRDTDKYAGQTVQVSGWIRNLRDSKAFGFIELNDGSFFKSVQIVFDTELDNFKEIAKLPLSSSVKVEGKVIATPGAKQPFEIKAEKLISRAYQILITHFKRNVIRLNTYVQLLTYAQEQMHSLQRSAYVLSQHLRFTNSSKSVDSYMFTHQSSLVVIQKVLAKCSA